MTMGSRFACPNNEPPAWLSKFERPLCFVDPRDWRSYLLAAHQSAKGAELKSLQRGNPPDHCADCERGSDHRIRAILAGTCTEVKRGPNDAS